MNDEKPRPTEANWLQSVTGFAQTNLIQGFLRPVHWTFKPVTQNNKVLWATSHAVRAGSLWIFFFVSVGFASLGNHTESSVEDRKSCGTWAFLTQHFLTPAISGHWVGKTWEENWVRTQTLCYREWFVPPKLLHGSLVGSWGMREAMRLSEGMNAFLPRVLLLFSRDWVSWCESMLLPKQGCCFCSPLLNTSACLFAAMSWGTLAFCFF